MPSFRHLKASACLNELAEDPLDLTQEGTLNPKRIDALRASALGFSLFFGTERVSDAVLTALCDLAAETEAVKKMADVQSGAVVNFIEGHPSEQRSALHTAMRDFFEQRQTAAAAKHATELAYKELEKLKAFLRQIDKEKRFTHLVQIGIGGSDLGPEAIYLALEAFHKPHRKVHFLSNVDPDDGARIFRSLDLKKTLVVVVSKSGSTLETLTNEAFIRDKYKKAGIDPKHHFLAVTGKGSPMDDPKKYLASFYIWDYIGGRYSATSMVGAVALAFALGIDRLLDFLRGASCMDKHALTQHPRENLPLLSALLGIWNRNFLDLPTVAVIPYSQALCRFPAHLQQLDMESNGKRIDKKGCSTDFDTGPIIWGEPGTNGQHSFFQSIHQGTGIVPIEFIGFKKSQYQEDVLVKGTSCQEKLLANLFAQSIALATGQKSANPNTFFPGNRPNRVLLAEQLDPFSMGALLAYYEHKVVFQGLIWNINSFDQEGVQLGKKLATQIINQFATLRQGKEIDAKTFPLGAAYLRNLKTVDELL
jgi:glucose-6-phosphate isomerase